MPPLEWPDNMPPLEVDEEVKKEKGSQILTPIKSLTRLPILSAQIKAGIHTNYKMKSDKY